MVRILFFWGLFSSYLDDILSFDSLKWNKVETFAFFMKSDYQVPMLPLEEKSVSERIIAFVPISHQYHGLPSYKYNITWRIT